MRRRARALLGITAKARWRSLSVAPPCSLSALSLCISRTHTTNTPHTHRNICLSHARAWRLQRRCAKRPRRHTYSSSSSLSGSRSTSAPHVGLHKNRRVDPALKRHREDALDVFGDVCWFQRLARGDGGELARPTTPHLVETREACGRRASEGSGTKSVVFNHSDALASLWGVMGWILMRWGGARNQFPRIGRHGPP
jgi:hypothetical protein